MIDRIAKQRLNVIMLVDCSKSMQGQRIRQVNSAISDIKDYLTEMQNENSNVDFYITVIPFSTEAYLLNGDDMKNVSKFKFKRLKGGGWSNLHLAYKELSRLLTKESKGGIMPDFGGLAPIILLMTDGHPTKWPIKDEWNELKEKPWFKVALKYGISIEKNDDRTISVLKDFVNGNGDVIECYDSSLLEKIIKVIVLTASKVKSQSNNVGESQKEIVVKEVRQQIKEALYDTNDWEW